MDLRFEYYDDELEVDWDSFSSAIPDDELLEVLRMLGITIYEHRKAIRSLSERISELESDVLDLTVRLQRIERLLEKLLESKESK